MGSAHSQVTSAAAADGCLLQGSRILADRRAGLSQTKNYSSWSQNQEAASSPSLNNSFRGLITFPCRKFFLSSQLSPSCCPVSPDGWVSCPSPTAWSQAPSMRNGTGAASIWGAVASAPAVAVPAGAWHGSDPDHLWQPETVGSQGVSVQPGEPPGTPICPVDAVLCVNSASLAPFRPYFMHPNAHQGRDLRNSHPFGLEENGNSRFTVPRGEARRCGPQSLRQLRRGVRDASVDVAQPQHTGAWDLQVLPEPSLLWWRVGCRARDYG